jgi:hypothetical protein
METALTALAVVALVVFTAVVVVFFVGPRE